MSKERKIAEIREEIASRVMKCTKLDLEALSLLLGILESNRKMKHKDTLTAFDELMISRHLLAIITLRAHDDDVNHMLRWCRAVMKNGVERRAEIAVA